jgi:hypothetical protein
MARRYGGMGAVGPQDINNNFYFQSGVGTIARGSYVGAGWVIML